LAIGIILETGALIAASFANKVWHLFLTQGLLFGWGSSFLYVGSIGIIPQWFTRRRGVANGIAAAGSGLGGLIYCLATEAMIQKLGLPWAFRITAICTFVVNSICAFLMRDRNKVIKPNQHSFDFRLLKRVEFLFIIGWAYFSILGYTVS
jgi:MFS family permease